MIKFRMSNGTFRLAQEKPEAKREDSFLKFSMRTWKRAEPFNTLWDDIASLYSEIGN